MRFQGKESGMKRGLRVWTLVMIGGLLVLLMAPTAGCDDPNPESTLVRADPSPVSTGTATVAPTGTHTPASTPEPTLTDTPNLVPTNTPTPLLATAKPDPTLTPTPYPTPTQRPDHTTTLVPTPTPKEVAVAQISQIVPWASDPPDRWHTAALELLTDIWVHDSAIATEIARWSWVSDGILEGESYNLTGIRDTLTANPRFAQHLLDHWEAHGLSEKLLWRVLPIASVDEDLAIRLLDLPGIDDTVADPKDSDVRPSDR